MDSNLAVSTMRIFESLTKEMFSDAEAFEKVKNKAALRIESAFVFSVIWGIGGSVDDKGRESLQYRLQSPPPTAGTLFDYVLDHQKNAWLNWNTLMDKNF